MNTYENINDLLEGDSMWRFGRLLYKYTGCGPWTVFHFDNGKAIYYDSRMANANKGILAMHGLTNCTSVEIGSIVEGSDVYIEGRHLEFPFTSEQLDATVKGVDDEASFYWKRDNTRNHCVTDGNGRKAFVSWTAFDDEPTWHDADDLPVEVKKAYLEWENTCQGYGEKHAEPLCAGWKIWEVCDDSTY